MGPTNKNTKTEPTEEQIIWLREAVAQGVRRKDMAEYMGVCEDTIRRILHRTGILKFEGAKFHHLSPESLWERPCMSCKDTAPRPRNQYFCNKCKERQRKDDGPYNCW